MQWSPITNNLSVAQITGMPNAQAVGCLYFESGPDRHAARKTASLAFGYAIALSNEYLSHVKSAAAINSNARALRSHLAWWAGHASAHPWGWEGGGNPSTCSGDTQHISQYLSIIHIDSGPAKLNVSVLIYSRGFAPMNDVIVNCPICIVSMGKLDFSRFSFSVFGPITFAPRSRVQNRCAQKVRLIRRQSVNLFDKAAYDTADEIYATHQLPAMQCTSRASKSGPTAQHLNWTRFGRAHKAREMHVSLSAYRLNCQFYPFRVLNNWQLLFGTVCAVLLPKAIYWQEVVACMHKISFNHCASDLRRLFFAASRCPSVASSRPSISHFIIANAGNKCIDDRYSSIRGVAQRRTM